MHARGFLAFVAAIGCLGACLGGCEVGSNYHPPAPAMPGAFARGLPQTQPTTRDAPAITRSIELTRWWHALGDPELDSLVERAVAANPDIEIAFTRLQQARTQETVVAGLSYPVADFSGGAGRGSGTNSTKSRIAGPLDAGTNTAGLREITQVVGFDAGWELDLFGKYRRQIEATRADTQAAAEARNAVLITVISDVARAYMDSRALQVRLHIALDDLRTQRQTVDLVQTRFNRGMTNELDLVLAQRELATIQAEISPLQEGVEQAKRRVAVLLGLFPEDLSRELTGLASLPAPPDEIQPGLPVELLRRRADIRQAERELAAATARIGVATANLFPRVAVTAGLGLQGQGLGREPERNTFLWSAGPTAYWPLLDFGTLDALVGEQDLQTHAALVNYKRTVLLAIEEVNNAIGEYSAEKNRLQSLSQALVASQRAVDVATQRYERGLTDFLNVLDAQRQFYDLQDQYALAQEAVVLQFIAVYKGLGGGWEGFAPAGPPPAPRPAIIAAVARSLHPNAEQPTDTPTKPHDASAEERDSKPDSTGK